MLGNLLCQGTQVGPKLPTWATPAELIELISLNAQAEPDLPESPLFD